MLLTHVEFGVLNMRKTWIFNLETIFVILIAPQNSLGPPEEKTCIRSCSLGSFFSIHCGGALMKSLTDVPGRTFPSSEESRHRRPRAFGYSSEIEKVFESTRSDGVSPGFSCELGVIWKKCPSFFLISRSAIKCFHGKFLLLPHHASNKLGTWNFVDDVWLRMCRFSWQGAANSIWVAGYSRECIQRFLTSSCNCRSRIQAVTFENSS